MSQTNKPEGRSYQRLLVTGGAGFIGANFVRFVLEARPNIAIINVDCLSYSGNLENLAGLEDNPRYRFVHASILERSRMAALLEEVDAVVHFAAESHVDRSIMDASPFIQTNIVGTQVLLDALRSTSTPKRLLHVSTDEVYGALPLEPVSLKFSETTPIAPNSPYAASKASSDLLVRAYHETFGLDACITRCSNNFGPYQFPEKLIPLFVTNLIEGKKVPLYGSGQNVRDWLHVDDHCEALLTVLEHGQSGEVYNIGGNNERSNVEITHSLLEFMQVGQDAIEHVPDRLGHDLRYAIDAGKIKRELGWQATRSAFPQALHDTAQWYIDNPSWWQRIKDGSYRDYYQRQYGQRS